MSQANFCSIHFLKVRYFPGKTDNKPTNRLLEFHSCSFYPATINFQNSPSSDLYMARDLSRLRRSPDRFAAKKACPALANNLVKFDSAVVSMVFQELCHLLAIFLYCSSSPCRSLLISKPTLCKTILSSSFVLESCTKTDKLFFLLWRHSLPKSREKQ